MKNIIVNFIKMSTLNMKKKDPCRITTPLKIMFFNIFCWIKYVIQSLQYCIFSFTLGQLVQALAG